MKISIVRLLFFSHEFVSACIIILLYFLFIHSIYGFVLLIQQSLNVSKISYDTGSHQPVEIARSEQPTMVRLLLYAPRHLISF